MAVMTSRGRSRAGVVLGSVLKGCDYEVIGFLLCGNESLTVGGVLKCGQK